MASLCVDPFGPIWDLFELVARRSVFVLEPVRFDANLNTSTALMAVSKRSLLVTGQGNS